MSAKTAGSPSPAEQLKPAPRRARSRRGEDGLRTLHREEAGVGSTLPELSRARTRRVCSPSESAKRIVGLEHVVKGAPSRLHSYATSVSLESKSNVASGVGVSPEGPETMFVSGGVESTRKRTAREGSLVLPAASVAVAVAV